MKILRNISLLACIALVAACGSEPKSPSGSTDSTKPKSMVKQAPESIREGKGVGEIKEVALTDPLEMDMVKNGQAIADMKCASCHKYTDQRVVGPGFQGVTDRRKPEWIMNMITNVDMMLEEDPTAQAMLEECLVRMPNQNVSVGDARDILEFMRHNDLERTGKKDGAASS